MAQFSCMTCARQFQIGSGLDYHCCAKGHAGLWECCGVGYYCRAHWDLHVSADERHCKATTDILACDVCSNTMSSVKTFVKHYQKVHGTQTTCPFCSTSSTGYVHDMCNNPSCGAHREAEQTRGEQIFNTVEPGPLLNEREERAGSTASASEPTASVNIEPSGEQSMWCPFCDIVFPSVGHLRHHEATVHDIVIIVSPKAKKLKRKLRKAAAKEQRSATMTESEKAAEKAAAKQRRVQKKLQTVERLKAEQERRIQDKKAEQERKVQEKMERKVRREQRRLELESKGPVACHVCSSQFRTPGSYAQHLESGTHPDINRHRVTQAVHMLDVIPPITLAPSFQYLPSDECDSYATSTITPFSSVPSSLPSSPIGETSLSGSRLHDSDSSLSGSLVLASSLSTESFPNGDADVAFPISPSFEPAATQAPNDLAHLGLPYACSLCSRTFRTAVGLTAHMDSPVHDPDAFKCPEAECGRQFALVSDLIQHLESGRCNAATVDEIFERFGLLTTKFSKYLTT